jgi:hypothetical protein
LIIDINPFLFKFRLGIISWEATSKTLGEGVGVGAAYMQPKVIAQLALDTK